MNLILIVAALFCFLVATVVDAKWFGLSGSHYGAWLAFGLVLYMASHLVGHLPWARRTTPE